MKREIAIIFIAILLFCISCHKKAVRNYEGEYIYQKGNEDIYYFKITRDSIYDLCLPEKYTVGHRYTQLAGDSIEQFDMVDDKNGSQRQSSGIIRIIQLSRDSIVLVYLDAQVYFISRRAGVDEMKKYHNQVYSLLDK